MAASSPSLIYVPKVRFFLPTCSAGWWKAQTCRVSSLRTITWVRVRNSTKPSAAPGRTYPQRPLHGRYCPRDAAIYRTRLRPRCRSLPDRCLPDGDRAPHCRRDPRLLLSSARSGLSPTGGLWHNETIGEVTLRTITLDAELTEAVQLAWQQALSLLPPSSDPTRPTIIVAPTTELFRQLTAARAISSPSRAATRSHSNLFPYSNATVRSNRFSCMSFCTHSLNLNRLTKPPSGYGRVSPKHWQTSALRMLRPNPQSLPSNRYWLTHQV